MFMLIGTPRETPRYYNFKDLDNKILTIGSTQKDGLFFKVQTELEDIDFEDFWKQFKSYRTEFLFKNYPSIEQYGINLESYKDQDSM
jgi:hypothetical protein